MTLLEALRNALARVVAARCELESGDTIAGDMILADLERDLVGIAERHDEPRGGVWVLELEGRAA